MLSALLLFSAIKMAMHCVYNNSMNCTESQKTMVKEAMEPILSLSGSHCGPETEEECNVTKALVDQFLPETCDKTAVSDCWTWLNSAKDYYTTMNNTKALCRYCVNYQQMRKSTEYYGCFVNSILKNSLYCHVRLFLL